MKIIFFNMLSPIREVIVERTYPAVPCRADFVMLGDTLYRVSEVEWYIGGGDSPDAGHVRVGLAVVT